jgi:hypothetical protein
MPRTYTAHKLTDAQLRRLSAIINNTKGAAKGGVAADALVRKGLVREVERPCILGNGNVRMVFDRREATDLGILSLLQARREGW